MYKKKVEGNSGLSMSTIFLQSHTASTNTIKIPIISIKEKRYKDQEPSGLKPRI
jgi:hypothetical protein